ncbi:hypothetical protein BJ165DRAFT_1532106 [Panaeolus papilionaceus]|nr:hypothetical protein BJ165DRAFT_1532106 [Panaeolus papilionaceus]
MTPSDVQVAEFAQLFDFFERLASRRARKSRTDASTAADDISTAPLPKDLVPVAKRLSTIVPTARKVDEYPATRPRRNTLASVLDRKASPMTLRPSDEGSDDEDDDASLAKFPLASKYPFTFKLMVHKLYRKDDWAKTVKEMLMKSKNEFKSLAEVKQEDAKTRAEEKEGEQEEQENRGRAEGGSVQVKVDTQPRARHNSGVSRVRQRSHSVVGVRRNSMMVTTPVIATPRSPVAGTAPRPDVRALKKRCVGRRRSMSMSGPMNGEETSPLSKGKLKGTWVYNSAVSYSERPTSARTPESLPFQPPPSPTEPLSRNRPMSWTPMMPLSAGFNDEKATRRGSLGGNMSFSPNLMSVSSVRKAKDGNLAARRRSAMLSGAEHVEAEEEKRPVKRPFLG